MKFLALLLPFIFVSMVSQAVSQAASRSIEHAPPSFKYADGKAIFIDILSAHYDLIFDIQTQSVHAESEIVFEALEEGYPIYDLVPEPLRETIDGIESISNLTSDPDGITRFRILSSKIKKGIHTLRISSSLKHFLVSFANGKVDALFAFSDHSGRNFLEAYLPANLEFDQVPMVIDVKVVGASSPHILRANGEVIEKGTGQFQVVFPDWYTASSLYFHLSATDAFVSEKFEYTSIDGRKIPVEVYARQRSNEFTSIIFHTQRILAELERDYGPYPHSRLLISTEGASMEYAGAASTSIEHLDHELFHLYNARSVMPANGNSGWMDEALSSWMDEGYPILNRSLPGSSNLNGHSPYMRGTDQSSYDQGAYFVAWLAGRLKANGQDFKLFLREYFTRHAHTVVTTDLFRIELEKYSGLEFKEIWFFPVRSGKR